MSFLSVAALSKNIEGIPVVQDLTLQQDRFQKLAIAGETGSGKSTLLKMIAGLVQPDSGEIYFEGMKVLGPDDQLLPGHPGIAYLSQHYELRHNYRMEELLEYANRLPEKQAATLFDICRISHLMKRKSMQLSGGEKQRLALARLLVGSPKLLLLDEPFSNLDPIHKDILKKVLADMGDLLQLTCILTSHDPSDTVSWADEILLMRHGKIIQQGNPVTVYRNPADAYAGGILGAYNLLDATAAATIGMDSSGIPPGKKIFLRPDQVLLSTPGNDSKEAIITATRFRGSWLELDIMISGVSLQSGTMDHTVRTGDKVHIRINAGTPWYV